MAKVRFLDRFTTILFDMHGTFAFDADRFGEMEDFFATWRRLGGDGLDRAIWTSVVFSSDGHSIKPSPRIFRAALAACGSAARETVFVGDSLARDIRPAKELVIATIWIGDRSASEPAPDRIVTSLIGIEELE